VLDSIRLDFDPMAAPFGLTVRLETLALGCVILIVLLLAALRAGWVEQPAEPVGARPRGAAGRLRRDDLILIGFGILPGAFAGGRLGYGLIHLDYYQAHPAALADPGQGGLALTLAVVFGTVSGLAVAGLLAAPIGRWLGVAGLPVLFGLGLGKLATVLGGAGQGSYSDASWATSYAGPGPWGSGNPGYPALPSQALEGALVLFAAGIMALLPILLRFRLRRWRRAVLPSLAPRHDWSLLAGGRGFVTLLAVWAAIRFAVAFTWRDARVLGPLGAEQLVLVAVMVILVLTLVVPGGSRLARREWASRRADRAARAARAASDSGSAPTSEVPAETAS
jgi:prolipoprotein diacylglyceryltransferase